MHCFFHRHTDTVDTIAMNLELHYSSKMQKMLLAMMGGSVIKPHEKSWIEEYPTRRQEEELLKIIQKQKNHSLEKLEEMLPKSKWE